MQLPAALRVPAQPREIAWQIGAPSFGAGTRDPSSGHREMPVNRMFFSSIFVALPSAVRERPSGLTACRRGRDTRNGPLNAPSLSLIHISEPTRLLSISYAV